MDLMRSRPRKNKTAAYFTAVFIAAIPLIFVFSCASIPRQYGINHVIYGQIDDITPQWQKLYPGLDISAGRIKTPYIEFWALRVNLADENLEIIVNEPEGNGKSLSSVNVSGFATQYSCLAAINAGPFSPVSAKTGEQRILSGVFISKGRVVSPPDPRYDALIFYNDGHAAVLSQNDRLENIRHAVGGFYTVLEDGALTLRGAAPSPRHPRSAAAVSGDGFTLYLLVIDGRRIGSIGATERETALLLSALGARDGILMDGGGSSALALYINGMVRIVNKPVHGGFVGHERAVGSCIGIKALKSGCSKTGFNSLP
ncbi:MAG: phosphodiester glycosidase family protein [Spirochaetaceae bacterium]|jgi:hypothetical protein|nr:phosphodiester glycosidase family protein [Spirochaetaceae bacterium]